MPENLIKISVRVIPNAPRNQVVGQAEGIWKIKVSAPPEKGKANKELLEFLARKLGLKRAYIVLEKGETARNKIVSFSGISRQELERLLTQD